MSMPHPPSVVPLARARQAPQFTKLFCDSNWQEQLAAARHEIRTCGPELVAPVLGLPANVDPAAYRWPVSGRHVAVYGALHRTKLRRLLAALLRDGALVAAGVDTEGDAHMACSDLIREVA